VACARGVPVLIVATTLVASPGPTQVLLKGSALRPRRGWGASAGAPSVPAATNAVPARRLALTAPVAAAVSPKRPVPRDGPPASLDRWAELRSLWRWPARGAVTAGPGCRQFTASVWCDDLGITAFSAQLGDQSDTLKVMANTQDVWVPFPVPVTMLGAGGDDVLEGSAAAPNRLDGGAGVDFLTGGSSADRLDLGPNGGSNAVGGAGGDFIGDEGGRDRIDAGAGNDSVLTRDGDIDDVTCGPGRDHVEADRADHVAADCDVPPAFRLRRPGWNGLTVHATLSGFSERVKVKVDAVRCIPFTFPGACIRGERPRSFAHRRFNARRGVVRKVKLTIPRSALPHLRRSPGNRRNRDVWLWVRARNTEGLTTSHFTRLKLIP
jgi:hypothetical protein